MLAFAGLSCATDGVGKRGGLKREAIEKFPPDIAKSYEVFEHKCSRCHTLSRPLNAPIYEINHWEAYVTRMRRQSGSGISESDAKTILVFLKYYAAQKKRALESDDSEIATSTAAEAQR
jgi:hypothetical protein